MGKELERKFLLNRYEFFNLVRNGDIRLFIEYDITQTYILTDLPLEIRVRESIYQRGRTHSLTIKNKKQNNRLEVITDIPEEMYKTLLNNYSPENQIKKRRIEGTIKTSTQIFACDVDKIFDPHLKYFYIIEVEFTSEDKMNSFEFPIEDVREITNDDRYKSRNLADTIEMYYR